MTSLVLAASQLFPPQVAVHLVRLACDLPDVRGRSLSQWDCAELARQLVAEGIVQGISPETVRRILESQRLKPWRYHYWLTPKRPWNAEFFARVEEIIDLYTRPLMPGEMVICVDEKTNLQPRPRGAPTRPAKADCPVRIEHEYGRCGAINLIAGFDTRSGRVFGRTAERKRQVEFLGFLEQLDREIPSNVTTIHLVLDNLSVHNGKTVQAWLVKHPRFVLHFTPVHCSWMNQIEQWFSILQRKRLRIVDFANKAELAARLMAFVDEWNERAHPFKWSTASVKKIMERRAAA